VCESMKARYLTLFALLLLATFAKAVEDVKIMHVSTGTTPSHIYLTITCTGTEPIDNLLIYRDGVLYRNLSLYLTPGSAIEVFLYLPAGRTYLIEVKTPGGGYDAINITPGMTEEQIKREAERAKRARELQKGGVRATTTTTTTLPPEIIPKETLHLFTSVGLAVVLILLACFIILWFLRKWVRELIFAYLMRR